MRGGSFRQCSESARNDVFPRTAPLSEADCCSHCVRSEFSIQEMTENKYCHASSILRSVDVHHDLNEILPILMYTDCENSAKLLAPALEQGNPQR
jgi:hypothetical protein